MSPPLVVVFLSSWVSGASAADLLLVGGRVWTGGTSVEYADIWLEGGQIRAVGLPGSLTPPASRVRVDVTGATVVPGLVDAHVHLSMNPGAAWREDSAEDRAALLDHHLRALLASGVTTVLDPAVTVSALAEMRPRIAAGPSPRYLHLGPPFSPPGGYAATAVPGFPTVADHAGVRDQVWQVAAMGGVGVKVTVEDGMYRPVWPLFSPERLREIRDAAALAGLPVYAHAMSPREQALAIEVLGASVLVHPLDRPDSEAVERVRAAGAWQMTTLSPHYALASAWGRLGVPPLDDPWYQERVPELERTTARDPRVQADFRTGLVSLLLPRFPGIPAIAASALPGRMIVRALHRQEAALRQLAAAGVPLVMGSDSGNWPMITSLFHGTSSIDELERLVHAGLDPITVLRAATVTPGEMLGLPIGKIEAGYRADLVVVDGDPTQGISALRRLRLVVREGVARAPSAWLSE